MKKIWTCPVIEEELLKAYLCQVMIDMLFYAGLKIIPECYKGLVKYSANKFKYHGICEGYLKCRMGFRCNDSWDNIYEMIEEEAERSLLVRFLDRAVPEVIPTECNLIYEESNDDPKDDNPSNDEFEFLRNLEAYGVLLKSVERTEDINKRCNSISAERMMEFE
jgi:hypothetical protein